MMCFLITQREIFNRKNRLESSSFYNPPHVESPVTIEF